MGGFDPWSPDQGEPLVKYHPLHALVLTLIPVNPGNGQCQLGSLTGAVSSQRVTEERKGRLSAVGNRVSSVKAQAGLTARYTHRADTKVGLSDPVIPCGRVIAHRIKGTPGITG